MEVQKNHIGLIIKEIVKKKRIPVTEIAVKIGLTRQGVYDTFSKKASMKLDEIERWAKVLEVPSQELLDKVSGNIAEFPKLPDDYLMRYVSELEERIKEQSRTMSEQAETIRVLLGKSKANGLRLGRGMAGSKSPIFLRIPV